MQFVIPIVMFFALSRTAERAGDTRFGGLGNLAWMCNVGNLLLAIGLFLNHKELIRASAIWTVPGLGVWICYVGLGGGPSSAIAHLGGIIVGLFVLSYVRMDRIAWLYAFVWYLFMQLIDCPLNSPLHLLALMEYMPNIPLMNTFRGDFTYSFTNRFPSIRDGYVPLYSLVL